MNTAGADRFSSKVALRGSGVLEERAARRLFYGVSVLLATGGAAAGGAMSPAAAMNIFCGGAGPMAWLPMPGRTWAGTTAAFLGMWMAMMMAMMLPSLAPALWRYRLAAGASGAGAPGRLAVAAGLGYFSVWTVAGAAVFASGAALASGGMWLAGTSAASIATGAVVLAAGLFQLTPVKARHLAGCRDTPACGHGVPPDAQDAWRFGLRLGLHCCVSCAGLTACLLAAGMMDPAAMAIVTAAIAAERLAPHGERVARAIGILAMLLGLALLAHAQGS